MQIEREQESTKQNSRERIIYIKPTIPNCVIRVNEVWVYEYATELFKMLLIFCSVFLFQVIFSQRVDPNNLACHYQEKEVLIQCAGGSLRLLRGSLQGFKHEVKKTNQSDITTIQVRDSSGLVKGGNTRKLNNWITPK